MAADSSSSRTPNKPTWRTGEAVGGVNGQVRVARSEVARYLAAAARGQRPPHFRRDRVADEPHRAVAQEQVDAAGVVAPGGRQGLVVTAVAAVPLPGRVRRVIVV